MSLLAKLHGRRRGRRLHDSQQKRMDELLPELTIQLPEKGKVDLSELQGESIWLEIGFGAGEHLAQLARRNPCIQFIGCESFYNGIASLVGYVQHLGLENVAVFPDDALPLVKQLPAQSIDRMFILFPDPWPKTRHHKRRLISKTVLNEIARVMKPEAELRIATDDESYAEWILELMLQEGLFEGPEGDVFEPPEDWVETRYQQRAQSLGNTCYFFSFIRKEVKKQ